MRRISFAFPLAFALFQVTGCGGSTDSPPVANTGNGGTTGGTEAAGGSASQAGGATGKGGKGGSSSSTGGAGGASHAGGSNNTGGATSHGGSAGNGAAQGGTAGAPGAGGSTGGTGGSGGASAAGGSSSADLLPVCTTFWKDRCHEWATCDATNFLSNYGDEPTCVSLHAQQCANTTLGPASTATVSDVAACFAAYGALDCQTSVRFENENVPRPAACNFAPGTLAEGAPCLASSECVTTFCQLDFLGGGCGVCAQPVKVGGSCGLPGDCPAGSACVPDILGPPGANGLCTLYVEKGAPCDIVPCHAEQACIGGVCADRIADGALCDPQEFGCGLLSGCNASKNKCQPLVFAASGGECGATADGSEALCPFGTWCRQIWQDEVGSCVPRKAMGDACELDLECPTLGACVHHSCQSVVPELCEGQAGMGGSGGAGGGSTFDHGAPSDVYPAPHPPLPLAKKGNGSVIKNPVIIPIFFPGDTLKASFVDFLTKLSGGTYFKETTSEYGIANPIVAPAISVTDAPPKQITDLEIRAYLQGKLDGTHPEFTPGGGDPLYTFFYPATTTINLFGIPSCQGFGGYHDTMIMPDGTPVPYAVIPRCQGISDTHAVTHELVEAFTDPVVGFAAYSGMEDSGVLWGVDGGEELGDLCEFFKSSTKTDPASGRDIQATWSNASAAASHAPCVPWIGPFFAAAPVMNDDIALPTLGVTTKGVRMAVGETRVIEADLYSDAPTPGGFTLAVFDYAESQGDPPELQVTIDKTSGVNGEKAAITITRLMKDQVLGAERFYVRAEFNGQRMSWLGVVGD